MYTRRSIGLLVTVAGMALSGKAVGQCEYNAYALRSFCRSEFDWVATCSGNTTGSMSGWATACWLESSYVFGRYCFPPFDDFEQSITAVSDYEESSADCPSGSFSIEADAMAGTFAHRYVECCSGGNSVTATEFLWDWAEQWGFGVNCEDPPSGRATSVLAGSAAGGMSVDFGGGYYTNYLPRIKVQVGFSFGTTGGCVEHSAGSYSPLRSLYYTRIKLVGYPITGSPVEEVHAAVFATRVNAGETEIEFVRLGFADDAIFDPEAGTNYDYEANQGGVWYSLGGTLPSTMSRYIIESVEDSFASFDGNVDGSEYVDGKGPTFCWNDRIALKAALGAVIGDEDYNPRADYDLDGTVEASDGAAIVAILGEVDVAGNLRRCLSFDFNCDGFLNASDYDDFVSAFDVSDPLADTNCDGFVNGNDYDDFVDGWVLGCP